MTKQNATLEGGTISFDSKVQFEEAPVVTTKEPLNVRLMRGDRFEVVYALDASGTKVEAKTAGRHSNNTLHYSVRKEYKLIELGAWLVLLDMHTNEAATWGSNQTILDFLARPEIERVTVDFVRRTFYAKEAVITGDHRKAVQDNEDFAVTTVNGAWSYESAVTDVVRVDSDVVWQQEGGKRYFTTEKFEPIVASLEVEGGKKIELNQREVDQLAKQLQDNIAESKRHTTTVPKSTNHDVIQTVVKWASGRKQPLHRILSDAFRRMTDLNEQGELLSSSDHAQIMTLYVFGQRDELKTLVQPLIDFGQYTANEAFEGTLAKQIMYVTALVAVLHDAWKRSDDRPFVPFAEGLLLYKSGERRSAAEHALRALEAIA